MGRWDYMAAPTFNPPSDLCPECAEPSKVFFIGGRTVDGVTLYTYACEHKHRWATSEKLELHATQNEEG